MRWEFRFDDEAAWRPVELPHCWGAGGAPDPARAGPAWYRTTLTLPELPAGWRAWLRFGAVSYDCELFVDGAPAGRHRGLWDSFRIELSGLAAPGRPAELLLRVERPAGPAAGPDGPPLPGRFPLRQTLAGFLPYVWGQIFGGLWQEVALELSGPAAIADLWARGEADGRVTLEVALDAPAEVGLELRDPDGALVATAGPAATAAPQPSGPRPLHRVRLAASIPDPRPWSPDDPALYTALVRVAGGEARELRFGLRSLAADGRLLRLNGRPLYPRMALSWGWYPEALHSNPGPAAFRAELERLRALGYNGVKLCLWFPPEAYLALADELGMLLWVELPLWRPADSPLLREQLPLEYGRLVRQARRHPAVILYSLGCELDGSLGGDLLGPLYRLVKGLAGDALVRDNSGSAEAYGGPLDEHADYDDHHFYAEPHLLPGLLDAFAPRWRRPRPWLLGEFCDLDTLRDAGRLWPGGPPWWADPDPARNPQGARYQYDLPWQRERLRAAGLAGREAELERLSERQALLHRKWTLELVRERADLGGYVVSGVADTPITSAGMWDDSGRLKFDPAAFRAFNADLVLLLGWGRRRAWLRGGDRPAPWDARCYLAGAPIRPHLVAANHSGMAGPATLRWELAYAGGGAIAAGEAAVELPGPGAVVELLTAEMAAPALERPRELLLRAELLAGGRALAANEWPLWVFPADPWPGAAGLALLDPGGWLAGLPAVAPGLRAIDAADLAGQAGGPVVIASAWDPELGAYVAAGGQAVLLQAAGGPPGPLAGAGLPFWREALRIVAPHPAWGDFPHGGWAGQLFQAMASDLALEPGASGARPILSRLDLRTYALHHYAAELAWGRGRLIISTLRLWGGQGDQPAGIAASPAAAHLLRCWAGYLGGGSDTSGSL